MKTKSISNVLVFLILMVVLTSCNNPSTQDNNNKLVVDSIDFTSSVIDNEGVVLRHNNRESRDNLQIQILEFLTNYNSSHKNPYWHTENIEDFYFSIRELLNKPSKEHMLNRERFWVAFESVFEVLPDFDSDGIPDIEDIDDDSDGYNDTIDLAPKDQDVH